MSFESFDLNSILSAPTTIRSETPVETQFAEVEEQNTLEFDEKEEIIQEVEEEQEPYNPEEEAEKLLGLIAAANNITMTPLALWRLKKKRGGKQVIERMQVMKAKQFSGQKLTENEQRLIDQYDAYLLDKQQLQQAIPYTEQEMEMLKQLAIPYCQSSKLKVNSGAAFWSALGGVQLQRIFAIIQA